ncbi:flagellar hook-associated protein FlgL [Nocardioides pakistanensis]
MSSLRITQRLMTERSLAGMQTSFGRLAKAQEQISTGRQINRPSDSPTGTNTAMRLREQMAADTQYARNASDGLSWLGRTDNTLSSMLDQTRRSRDLMVQATNGTQGPESREALAKELEQLRESLLAAANTQHMGRPLFGGTTGLPRAYDPATGAYLGQPAPSTIERTVGDGVTVAVNTVGPEAFSSGTTDLFKVLDDAVTAIRSGGSPGPQLAQLDGVMDKMMTALADVGTRYGRVEQAQTKAQNAELDMTAMLSEVENVDIAKAIVDLQMQEVAYQAALGATARVIQPSLLDFLR